MSQDSRSRASQLGLFMIGTASLGVSGICGWLGYRDQLRMHYLAKTPLLSLEQLESFVDPWVNLSIRPKPHPIFIKTCKREYFFSFIILDRFLLLPFFETIFTDGRIGSDSALIVPNVREKVVVYERKTELVSMLGSNKETTSYDPPILQKSKYYISEGKGRAMMCYAFKLPELQTISTKETIIGDRFLSLVMSPFTFYPYKVVTKEKIAPINQQLFVTGCITRRKDGTLEMLESKDHYWDPKYPPFLTYKSEKDVVKELTQNRNEMYCASGLMAAFASAAFVGMFFVR
eukprot:TRINITY_DN2187_c0_g1_i2.p1 TRINITY_DN2187_c0_g1~~TRINITY_DN2187_c0_g1_i2.p1  ORF type:complete len:289 (-),score=56.27 TRINITY_DN2187_c0_g1_i2:201-1067(-)